MSINQILTDILRKNDLSEFLSAEGNSNANFDISKNALFVSISPTGEVIIDDEDGQTEAFTFDPQALLAAGLISDEDAETLMGLTEEDGIGVEDGTETQSLLTEAGTAALANTAPADVVNNVDAPEAAGESGAIQAELDGLNAQLATVQQQIEDRKELISEKMEDIKAAVADLMEEIENDSEEAELEAKAAIEAAIEDYEARVLNGEEVEPAEISGQIANILAEHAFDPNSFAGKLMAIETDMTTVKSMQGQLKTLMGQEVNLMSQIETKEVELEEAETAEAAREAAASSSESCDPIGFQSDITLENGDTVKAQFDLVYAEDDEESIDELSDFVGATGYAEDGEAADGFQEILDMNTDNDDMVTADEMDAAGVKAVMTYTDADGKEVQELVSMDEMKEIIGEDDISIDIGQGSYVEAQNGVSTEYIGTDNPFNFESNENNELLANFAVNIGDEQTIGYQTADETDWLAQNYGSIMTNDLLNEIEAGTATVGNAVPLEEGEEPILDMTQENAQYMTDLDAEILEVDRQIDAVYDKLELEDADKQVFKDMAKIQSEAEIESLDMQADLIAEEAEAAEGEDEVPDVEGEDGIELENDLEPKVPTEMAYPTLDQFFSKEQIDPAQCEKHEYIELDNGKVSVLIDTPFGQYQLTLDEHPESYKQ